MPRVSWSRDEPTARAPMLTCRYHGFIATKEAFVMDDAMDEATKFADRLLDLRRKAGYSQEQLADLLGVSRQAISKWEGAQGRPEVDNVVKLSQIYRVSTDFILTGSASVPSVCEAPSAPAPRELSREYRFALSALMVIAGTALVFVLVVSILAILSMVLTGGADIPGWK
ncbi:DNA-binding helix-turn-helix protein [Collinsella stercoris DSM 13279]|uniref:DNA-binding helix-turn-helix protein n=2 Tax=Collinsella TaxID=102106 RepID=B6GD35_9ACTN|nr:DNA-binding helix-turn-helix protein [Collinsella stercoris DSM 13279]